MTANNAFNAATAAADNDDDVTFTLLRGTTGVMAIVTRAEEPNHSSKTALALLHTIVMKPKSLSDVRRSPTGRNNSQEILLIGRGYVVVGGCTADTRRAAPRSRAEKYAVKCRPVIERSVSRRTVQTDGTDRTGPGCWNSPVRVFESYTHINTAVWNLGKEKLGRTGETYLDEYVHIDNIKYIFFKRHPLNPVRTDWANNTETITKCRRITTRCIQELFKTKRFGQFGCVVTKKKKTSRFPSDVSATGLP